MNYCSVGQYFLVAKLPNYRPVRQYCPVIGNLPIVFLIIESSKIMKMKMKARTKRSHRPQFPAHFRKQLSNSEAWMENRYTYKNVFPLSEHALGQLHPPTRRLLIPQDTSPSASRGVSDNVWHRVRHLQRPLHTPLQAGHLQDHGLGE